MAWPARGLGRVLHHEDPLQTADVIYVLAGTRLERVAEAGALYLEGWAPRILLSRPERDGGERALVARGLPIPSAVDVQRQALLAMRRTGITLIMRASRFDPSDVNRWWTHRATLPFVLIEAQKLVVYWVGVAD